VTTTYYTPPRVLDPAVGSSGYLADILANPPFSAAGWVRVADREPAPGVEVLAYFGRKPIDGGVFMRVVYRHGQWSTWVDGRSTYEAPTHWMPLPEPPEEAQA
jgi:hypothetical protein